MVVAVTDTQKEDKQKLYLDWLHRIDPTVETRVLSYVGHNGRSLSGFDGLLLTGGGDIHPKFYRQNIDRKIKGMDEQRDMFELSLLESALDHSLPILGICRGMQIANVFFGGTLHKDVVDAGFHKHSGDDGKECRHPLVIENDSFIFQAAQQINGNVNSFHHQAIDTVGKQLRRTSSSDDGITESLEWRDKSGKPYLLLVQWHPERMTDFSNPLAEGIGKKFLHAVTFNQHS